MVHLVALLEATQDADRVLDGRLFDDDRLKAALQRRVLFDVLAVLVERGRADAAQLAASERRLEHVARVHRPLRGAGTNQGVQLIDEEDHGAVRRRDLLEHRLEAVLELAAILAAGDHRAEVERDHALVLEALGHVAGRDPLGEPLGDRGLTDTRLADEHGVVLGPPGEHLDDPANLVVTADHRVELAATRRVGQVAAVLLERLVFGLRVRVRHPLRASDRLERGVHPVGGDAGLLEQAPRLPVTVGAQREQQVFGGNVLVLETAHLFESGQQHRPQRAADRGIAHPHLLGAVLERRVQARRHRLRGNLEPAQERRHQAVLLLEERQQQMLGLDRGMLQLLRGLLRGCQRLLRAFGESVESHQLVIPPRAGG